jgi:hypothetical protein
MVTAIWLLGGIESQLMQPVVKKAECRSRNRFAAGAIAQVDIADNY